jgi:hypothetical protein
MEIKVSDSEQRTRSVVTQALKLEEECLSKKQSTEQHDVLRGNYNYSLHGQRKKQLAQHTRRRLASKENGPKMAKKGCN